MLAQLGQTLTLLQGDRAKRHPELLLLIKSTSTFMASLAF